MRGETWWENCLCGEAKNLPLFSTLFLGRPPTGSRVDAEKQISPLRCSQQREQLRSKGRWAGDGEKKQQQIPPLRCGMTTKKTNNRNESLISMLI